MSGDSGAAGARAKRPAWYRELAKYEEPQMGRVIGQLLNTILPYLLLLALMIYLVKQGYSYWLTLAIAPLTASFLMRAFIIFHDCCHGSFVRSKLGNTLLGYFIGALAFTPFDDWRSSHLKHHATFANLDRRGTGDIKVMTVDEYRAASPLARAAYWVYRNPFFLFSIGAVALFLLLFRLPIRWTRSRELFSVLLLDVAIVAIVLAAHYTVGWRVFVLAQAPVLVIAWTTGVWFFYVQHQFNGVYWAREKQWDFLRAALEGSSYYQLPRVLQWITGNIGLHHLHHLRPRIPNYRLQHCYNENPAVQAVKPVTLHSSLQSLHLNLWDEQRQQLVSFHSLRKSPPGE